MGGPKRVVTFPWERSLSNNSCHHWVNEDFPFTKNKNPQILGITPPFSLMTIGNQFPQENYDCGHASKVFGVCIVTAIKQ